MGRAGVVRSFSSASSEFAQVARGVEIAHHDGERLAVAVLALAQAHDGGFVGGVDGEMESADAFDGHDFAGDEAVDSLRQPDRLRRIGAPSAVDEPELRAAVPAGIGLGVEAAVEWIVVLGLAGGAHFEARHRGLRAVVGDAAGDGEARAAVGAIEKWIAVAAVGGIEQFAQAVGAGGGVGGNAGAHAAEDFAGDDAEPDLSPVGAISRTVTESMRARGGASERRRVRKVSMRCGGDLRSR